MEQVEPPKSKGNMTAAVRRQKAGEAYFLSLKRYTLPEIAERLEINRNTAHKLIKEEQERQWQARDLSGIDDERRRAIHTYEEVIRSAWVRLGRVRDNSLNVSGLFNTIIRAQNQIDMLTGVRLEREDNTTNAATDFLAGAEAYRQIVEERRRQRQEQNAITVEAEPVSTDPAPEGRSVN